MNEFAKDVPLVCFREPLADLEEVRAAAAFFKTCTRLQLARVMSDSMLRGQHRFVIPRYASSPFYSEFRSDVEALGGRVVNSSWAHSFLTRVSTWSEEFASLTPKTWNTLADFIQTGHHAIEDEHRTHSFVLKGQVTSRRQLWHTHMFAPSVEDVPSVFFRLSEDPLIAEEGIVIRQFERFQAFDTDPITKVPITNEWRVFVFDGEVLASGYYWSQHEDTVWGPEDASRYSASKEAAEGFVRAQIAPVLHKLDVSFAAVDVAPWQNGEWRLIELNDGCMSGLCSVAPDELYKAMAQVLHRT